MDSYAKRLPPLRGIMAFEAAARHGSFTSAADELNVSQPAISRQVRGLEEALGIDLFRRIHRRVELTEAGRRYLDAVVSCFDHMIAVGDSLALEEKRPITLSANYGLASYWLLPRLSVLQENRPDLDFALQTVEQDVPLDGSGNHISIRFGNGRWRDGHSRILFGEETYALCSPGYLNQTPPVHSAADLQTHRLLRVKSEPKSWINWTGFLKKLGVRNPKISGPVFNNYTLAMQAALAGQGMIIGWDRIADDFLERGWLVKALPQSVGSNKGYYAVVDAGAESNEAVAAILAYLCDDAPD